MSRILFVGSGVPWAGGAGYRVRQDMFLRALADVAATRGARLELHLFDAGSQFTPPPFPADVTAVPSPVRSKHGRLFAFGADMLSSMPRMFRGIERARPAGSLANGDAVFAYRIDFAYFAGMLGRPGLLLDVDDPEHVRARRRAVTLGQLDPRTARDLNKLRQFEQKAVAEARAAFVCQVNDQAAFPTPTIVVPNCVDIPAAPPADAAAAPPVAIFVANLAGGGADSPNVDAARWLAREIWPLIRRNAPDAELHVVGQTSPSLGAELSAVPGVRCVGFVDRLVDVYATAACALAPIRFGTGTRIKILEAMAHACPVVSTPVGAEGLEVAADQDILLGTTAAEFAHQCVSLLRDPPARYRVGRDGFTTVKTKYNRQARHAELVRLLGDLIDAR